MNQLSMRDAVEISIKDGILRGVINEKKDAAALEMIRYMANELDTSDSDTPILRYVTPASFLSYCEKLGFVPEIRLQDKPKQVDKNSKLHVVGNSQWKRA